VTPVNAGSTYAFSVSGSGNTLGAQSGNQQVVNWGTNSGIVSVVETNAANCSGSGSLSVTVSPLPTVQTVSLSNQRSALVIHSAERLQHQLFLVDRKQA
jgi:hypothetical protein